MKKILIADDEKDFSKLLKSELENEGYSVDVAYDGVEAVIMAVDNHYDIALIDMTMPWLDGLNAARILKKIKSNMPIIAFSGSLDHKGLSSIIDAGALMFVHKPFAFAWIISQIRWVIGD